jgi:uncharacterized protein GlcG (DUF336 family)
MHMALTTQQTKQIIDAAETKAQEMGLAVAVCVVDQNGLMKGFLKMDGAWFTTNDIALGKAKAAAGTKRSNADTADRAGRPVFQYQLVHMGAVFAQGGEPIFEGDACVGAVGISGAPGGPQDEEIARAALAAL